MMEERLPNYTLPYISEHTRLVDFYGVVHGPRRLSETAWSKYRAACGLDTMECHLINYRSITCLVCLGYV